MAYLDSSCWATRRGIHSPFPLLIMLFVHLLCCEPPPVTRVSRIYNSGRRSPWISPLFYQLFSTCSAVSSVSCSHSIYIPAFNSINLLIILPSFPLELVSSCSVVTYTPLICLLLCLITTAIRYDVLPLVISCRESVHINSYQ